MNDNPALSKDTVEGIPEAVVYAIFCEGVKAGMHEVRAREADDSRTNMSMSELWQAFHKESTAMEIEDVKNRVNATTNSPKVVDSMDGISAEVAPPRNCQADLFFDPDKEAFIEGQVEVEPTECISYYEDPCEELPEETTTSSAVEMPKTIVHPTVARIRNEGLRTYDEWKRAGYRVLRGKKALLSYEGSHYFSRIQVIETL